MRTDELREEARRLEQLVAGLERRAKTTPVPMAVRRRLVAFATRATTAGWTLRAVAQALGVSIGSLRNWRAASLAPTALVPIVVTAPPVVRPLLTVVAPSGYRVEGLDVPTAAALLRTLA
jgi:hypothetical protein